MTGRFDDSSPFPLQVKRADYRHVRCCKDCHSCSISNFYVLAQSSIDFEANAREALNFIV